MTRNAGGEHGAPDGRDPNTEAGGPDTPPPSSPHELESDSPAERAFTAEGADWIARLSGKSAGGTGPYGLAMVQSIHFYHADHPDTPVREALAARGRFDGFFDEELRRLLARATPIRLPEAEGPGDARRSP